jgi:hypothetical protein
VNCRASRFFELDRAVEGYMTIAKDPKFASSEHRREALGLSASLLDDDQQYTRAADIYKTYSDAISSKPHDSADAYFLACNAYDKAHEANKQSGCLREFINKFNKQQEAGEYIVQAYAKQAVITESSTKNKGEILRAYKRVRDESLSRKLPGATPAAALAAKADFLIMKKRGSVAPVMWCAIDSDHNVRIKCDQDVRGLAAAEGRVVCEL